VKAWARFAARRTAASAAVVPVATLTVMVITARLRTSSHRHRDSRCAVNQRARIPAAGQARLRFVSSITVNRPSTIATRYRIENPAVRAAERTNVMGDRFARATPTRRIRCNQPTVAPSATPLICVSRPGKARTEGLDGPLLL
jgi:hypothetical protein